MALGITFSRQRVPMVDPATLEDRTRPAMDDSLSTRMRFYQWPTWSERSDRTPTHQDMRMQARLGRR